MWEEEVAEDPQTRQEGQQLLCPWPQGRCSPMRSQTCSLGGFSWLHLTGAKNSLCELHI
jgi:hypothetical protein